VRINYSESLSRLGFHPEALSLHEQLVVACKEAFGSNHNATLRVLDNSVNTLSELGRLDEAKRIGQQLLELRGKNLGEHHPLTLRVANNLGCCLLKEGDFKNAEVLIRKAVDASREHYGADFPATTQFSQNLATLLSMQGPSDESIKMFRDIIARMTRILNADHVDVLAAKARYAAALSFQKRFHEAKQEYEQLLAQYRRTLSDDQPNTLICMDNLASAHGAIGEYEQAIQLVEQIVTNSVRKYPKMPFTLKAIHGLIEYRILAGRPLDSAEELRHVIELYKANNFSFDWMVMDFHHMAIAYLVKNEPNESVRIMRELVEVCDKQLGPSNVNSLVNKLRLADLLIKRQEESEAHDLQRVVKSTLSEKQKSSNDTAAFHTGMEQLKALFTTSPMEIEGIANAFVARSNG